MHLSSKKEAEIHELFDITLLLKGLHASIEVIGGILLYAVSAQSILGIVNFFVRAEIREDPRDVIANALIHAAQSFGGNAQSFAAFYLLLHGVINGSLVIALYKEKLWAYPVAFVVIGAFIAYQLYLFLFGFSWWLTALTALDIAVIFLIRHEYGVLKKRAALRRAP